MKWQLLIVIKKKQLLAELQDPKYKCYFIIYFSYLRT